MIFKMHTYKNMSLSSMICYNIYCNNYVATKQSTYTYPVLNAIPTSSRMSGAQATSSDIDFLY